MDIIYGLNPIIEALKARRRTFIEVVTCRQDIGEIASLIPAPGLHTVSRRDLDRMAGNPFHQGIAARVSPYPYVTLHDLVSVKILVMLDSIEDPQNLGAIIRSAYALAGAGIVIPEDRSASITAAVVKASAGATEHARIARVKNLRSAARDL
ncbi:MAG: RNA methyltransferase substrate-binding domain-containing protein, partial [Desulfomonilia bacterium]|nr:RNA methyltransferase substrate-binding domain-containing protein [Desulfomonilia bacterium]